MSKIAIVVQGNVTAPHLMQIKRIINDSIDRLKINIDEHNPIYIGNLFYNDHQQIAEKLLSLTALLNDQHIDYAIYELSEEDSFDEIKSNAEMYAISLETMKNILDSFTNEVEHLAKG
jgi:hypothetical protein